MKHLQPFLCQTIGRNEAVTLYNERYNREPQSKNEFMFVKGVK